jgi:hypothetical protein
VLKAKPTMDVATMQLMTTKSGIQKDSNSPHQKKKQQAMQDNRQHKQAPKVKTARMTTDNNTHQASPS